MCEVVLAAGVLWMYVGGALCSFLCVVEAPFTLTPFTKTLRNTHQTA